MVLLYKQYLPLVFSIIITFEMLPRNPEAEFSVTEGHGFVIVQ